MSDLLRIAGYVTQQGELGRQRGQQNRLAALASQAYGAAPDQQRGFVQQAIATDPQSGFALGRSLGDDRQQRMGSLSQKARLLVGYAKAGNRQGVDGLYPQLAQEAQALGLAPNIPTAWDDSYLPGIEQLANIAMHGNSAPAGLQEFNALTQGLSAEDQLAARRIKLGLDGRASSAGYSQVKFTGSDGRERIGVLNGKTGQIDLPDGTSFNPQTGQIAPTQQMGAPAPAVLAEDGQAMPVTQFTGSDGRPVNIGNDIPAHLRQQLLSQTQAFEAAPEGSTANLPPVNLSPAQFRGGASPFVGRRAEDEAAAKKAAELGVEMAYLPQRQAIETQGAIERTRGTEQAKAEIERGAEQQKRQREQGQVFAQYQAAISGLRSGLANSATGPLAGRLPAITANQQIAEGSVAALAPVLKQLFRAAGEGTFTDRDQALLLEMVPTRTDLPAAREAKLQNIDNIVRAKLGQGGIYGAAPADAPQSNAIPAPGHTEGGYRFRGGNPADPNSWERI